MDSGILGGLVDSTETCTECEVESEVEVDLIPASDRAVWTCPHCGYENESSFDDFVGEEPDDEVLNSYWH